MNAQAGRGCEVEWHSSKPSSPYPCLFLSLNRQTILPLSPAQRNSLTASPQRHYGNQAATKAVREAEREGEGREGWRWWMGLYYPIRWWICLVSLPCHEKNINFKWETRQREGEERERDRERERERGMERGGEIDREREREGGMVRVFNIALLSSWNGESPGSIYLGNEDRVALHECHLKCHGD